MTLIHASAVREKNQKGRLSKPDISKWLKDIACQDLIIKFWVLFTTFDKSKYSFGHGDGNEDE